MGAGFQQKVEKTGRPLGDLSVAQEITERRNGSVRVPTLRRWSKEGLEEKMANRQSKKGCGGGAPSQHEYANDVKLKNRVSFSYGNKA